jgi:KDO2-lipid IV(A) lauroyltransferase
VDNSDIFNKLLKITIISLSKISSLFPRKLSLFIGQLFAKFIYAIYRLSSYKNHISNNIKSTLPISDAGAKKMAKRHIIKLTKNLVDLFRFKVLTEDNFDKIVLIKNPEFFQEAVNEKKGVILVSAHYGCWELIGAAISLKFKNVLNVLVQKPSNPVFDELFIQFREKAGTITHYNNSSVLALRPLFRALENKECLGFLIDQHGESEDTFGEFFGKVVSIPSGPALFAYKTGAPIVPVFIRRTKDDRHEIIFYPVIHINSSGDKEAEVHKVSRGIYKIIENTIKEKPDEWLWIYERWNKLSLEGLEIASSMQELKGKEISR